MRLFSVACLLALIVLAGCAAPQPVEFNTVPGPSQSKAVLPSDPAPAPVPVAKRKPAPTQKRKPATTTPPTIATPDTSLRGQVRSYNEALRFVLLEFPITHLPGVGQKLFVYRNGLKIGELKVTGPQRDDHTVADLTEGAAQPGDEVREQ